MSPDTHARAYKHTYTHNNEHFQRVDEQCFRMSVSIVHTYIGTYTFSHTHLAHIFGRKCVVIGNARLLKVADLSLQVLHLHPALNGREAQVFDSLIP